MAAEPEAKKVCVRDVVYLDLSRTTDVWRMHIVPLLPLLDLPNVRMTCRALRACVDAHCWAMRPRDDETHIKFAATVLHLLSPSFQLGVRWHRGMFAMLARRPLRQAIDEMLRRRRRRGDEVARPVGTAYYYYQECGEKVAEALAHMSCFALSEDNGRVFLGGVRPGQFHHTDHVNRVARVGNVIELFVGMPGFGAIRLGSPAEQVAIGDAFMYTAPQKAFLLYTYYGVPATARRAPQLSDQWYFGSTFVSGSQADESGGGLARMGRAHVVALALQHFACRCAQELTADTTARDGRVLLFCAGADGDDVPATVVYWRHTRYGLWRTYVVRVHLCHLVARGERLRAGANALVEVAESRRCYMRVGGGATQSSGHVTVDARLRRMVYETDDGVVPAQMNLSRLLHDGADGNLYETVVERMCLDDPHTPAGEIMHSFAHRCTLVKYNELLAKMRNLAEALPE